MRSGFFVFAVSDVILDGLGFGGVKLDIAFLLVFLLVCMVVHGARHISAFTNNTIEYIHRYGALDGVKQTGFGLKRAQRRFINTTVFTIRATSGTVLLLCVFMVPSSFTDATPSSACRHTFIVGKNEEP